MKLYLSYFTFCFLLFNITSHAQTYEDGRLFGELELGYLSMTGKLRYSEAFVAPNKGHGYRARTSMNYFFYRTLSAGLGIGFDGYSSAGYNTIPLYLNVKKYLHEDGHSFYGFGNLGYALQTQDHFEKGIMGALGFGLRLTNRRKPGVAWNASVGWNIQRLESTEITILDITNGTVETWENIPLNLNSIAFNLAFVF